MTQQPRWLKCRAGTVALAALLALAACAPQTSYTALAASGYGILGVGKVFVDLGGVYTAKCLPAPTASDLTAFCAGFETFAPRFQSTYPIAVQAWKDAVRVRDVAAAQGAEAVVLELATDLSDLAVAALAATGVHP